MVRGPSPQREGGSTQIQGPQDGGQARTTTHLNDLALTFTPDCGIVVGVVVPGGVGVPERFRRY